MGFAFFAAFSAFAGLLALQGATARRPARRAAPGVRQSRTYPHEVDDLDASGLRGFVADPSSLPRES